MSLGSLPLYQVMCEFHVATKNVNPEFLNFAKTHFLLEKQIKFVLSCSESEKMQNFLKITC